MVEAAEPKTGVNSASVSDLSFEKEEEGPLVNRFDAESDP